MSVLCERIFADSQFLCGEKGWLILFSWGSTGWLDELMRGSLLTIFLAVSAFIFANIIGLVGGFAAYSPFWIVRKIVFLYTSIARCLPELVIVLAAYFAILNIFSGFEHISILGAPIAIAMISGAYSIEVYRGALLAVPQNEIEAAQAYGMHKFQIQRRIIMPHLFRIALPSLGNVWLLLLKDTVLISLVGLKEVMTYANIATQTTKALFPFYFFIMIAFLVITVLSGQFFKFAERRTQHYLHPSTKNTI